MIFLSIWRLAIAFQSANDELKQTGSGQLKPLSEFQLLCLELVKAAKGKASVEYVKSVSEPSATDRPTITTETRSKVTKSKEKSGKTAKAKAKGTTTPQKDDEEDKKLSLKRKMDVSPSGNVAYES